MTENYGVGERWMLLGQLTELFNEAEVLLHPVVWAGMGIEDWTMASLITYRLGATQLLDLGKAIVRADGFGARKEHVDAIIARAEKLIADRNGYVHAFWTPDATSTEERALIRQLVRDAVKSPGERATPFDIRDLRRVVFALRQFIIDIAELVAMLHPGLADDESSQT